MSSEYQPCLNIILTSVDGMSPYRTYENINYGGSGDYYIDNLYGYGTYVVSLNNEYKKIYIAPELVERSSVIKI